METDIAPKPRVKAKYFHEPSGLFRRQLRFPSGKRTVYAKTPTELKQKFRELERELEQAVANGGEGSKALLKNYLTETWLPALKESGAKPATLWHYEEAVRAWINPFVGDLVLGKINGYDAHRLMDKLKDAGKSNYTRAYALRVLRSALAYAVHLRAIPTNPFMGIKPPKFRTQDFVPWTLVEANHFLASGADPIEVLAIETGCRIGELLALWWEDVSIQEAVIHVRWTLLERRGKTVGRSPPKTTNSIRSVPLTKRAVAVLKALREEQLANGKTQVPWVFSRRGDLPRYRRTVFDGFQRRAKAAGLPVIRLHDLRHTHASLLVQAGVNYAEAAQRMGHTVAMFLKTYVHVSKEQARGVADQFEALTTTASAQGLGEVAP